MNINEARLIREVKKRCTYRRLAEVYYPGEDLGHGIQGYGEDLCKEALKVLYPNVDLWRGPVPQELEEDNWSNIGRFFWWE